MASPPDEIEQIKAIVARRFPVYEVRVRPELLTFFVHVDPSLLDVNFEELRKTLIPKGYIPLITKEKGEHVVLVQRKPPTRPLGLKFNIILFAITIITTIFAGMVNWAAYDDLPIFDLTSVAYGALFFALPLLAILGIHEMGHYITARRYKVAASLPFFIPSIPPLGTFGALISMREPIPNRRALLDIGVAGPIFGLIVAIPVSLIGLFLIGADPKPFVASGGSMGVEAPLIYQVMLMFIPIPGDVRFHPTAFAGWVGIFVTALNLIPAGQLDGGHVARAVLGDRARYLSYFALGMMFFFGLFFFQGWLIIAIFILLLGARHPPPLNDITRLGGRRKAIGALALIVFIVTFHYQPLTYIEPQPDFALIAPVPFEVNVTKGNNATANFTISNTGNIPANLTVEMLDVRNLDNVNLTVSFLNYSGSGGNKSLNNRTFFIELYQEESVNVTFLVNATDFILPGSQTYTFRIKTTMYDLYEDYIWLVKEMQVSINVS